MGQINGFSSFRSCYVFAYVAVSEPVEGKKVIPHPENIPAEQTTTVLTTSAMLEQPSPSMQPVEPAVTFDSCCMTSDNEPALPAIKLSNALTPAQSADDCVTGQTGDHSMNSFLIHLRQSRKPDHGETRQATEAAEANLGSPLRHAACVRPVPPSPATATGNPGSPVSRGSGDAYRHQVDMRLRAISRPVICTADIEGIRTGYVRDAQPQRGSEVQPSRNSQALKVASGGT
jgi:hypothetical protein